jgi:uncharacterized protein YjiS (DUF1127 family)
MSTIYSAPAIQGTAGPQFSLRATLRQWCVSYMGWRAERAATAHLRAMSDRDLRDIGLLRSQLAQVEGAPSGQPGAGEGGAAWLF